MYNLLEHIAIIIQKHHEVYINIAEIIPVAIVDFANDNTADSFKCKAKMTGQTGIGHTKRVELMVSSKYVSNFWRTLEMPPINCEVNFILNWYQERAIFCNALEAQAIKFAITNKRHYILVVTLSTQNNAKPFEQLQ